MLELSIDCRQETKLWNNSSLVNYLHSYMFYSFVNTRGGEVSYETPLKVNSSKPGFAECGFGYELLVGTLAEMEVSKVPASRCLSLRCLEVGERWTGSRGSKYWARFERNKLDVPAWVIGELKVFCPDKTKMGFVVGKEYLCCIHKGYQIDSPKR